MDLQLPATGDCSAELQAALAANDSVRLLPHDGVEFVDLVRCSAHSRPDRLVRMVRTRSDARVVTKDCNGLPDGTWKASFSGLIDFTHNVDA